MKWLLSFTLLALCLGTGMLVLGRYRPETLASVSQYTKQFEPLVVAGDRAFAAAKRSAGQLAARFKTNLTRLEQNLFVYRLEDLQGSYRLSASDVLQLSGIASGQTLLNATPQDISDKLRSSPWVERAQARWGIFPLRLSLQLTEAEPWLVAECDEHSWLLSRKAKLIVPLAVLEDADLILEASSLPRLDVASRNRVFSSYLSSENARLQYSAKMVSFIELAGNLPFGVLRYELEGDGSLVVFPEERQQFESVRLKVSSYEEAEVIKQRLQKVLEDLQQRGEHVNQIDLRYHRQAVLR